MIQGLKERVEEACCFDLCLMSCWPAEGPGPCTCWRRERQADSFETPDGQQRTGLLSYRKGLGPLQQQQQRTGLLSYRRAAAPLLALGRILGCACSRLADSKLAAGACSLPCSLVALRQQQQHPNAFQRQQEGVLVRGGSGPHVEEGRI